MIAGGASLAPRRWSWPALAIEARLLDVLLPASELDRRSLESLLVGDIATAQALTGEFGRLSRFFNQMLDRVQTQQGALTEANRELVSEISVRKQVF